MALAMRPHCALCGGDLAIAGVATVATARGKFHEDCLAARAPCHPR